MKTTIDITDITSRDLKSRESARRAKKEIDELVERTGADMVEVDFEKVEFSTRCFMDEFYNLFLSSEAREQECATVEVVNVPEDIRVILAAVVRSNTAQSN